MAKVTLAPMKINDETLARVAKAPTTFAAWVLRAIAQELIERRREARERRNP